MGERQAILIAGPTASGKSALALHLAERHGGIVVNADSMQVYDGLRILTARPDDDDLARAEHRLYGHVDPATPYSAGAYLREAAAVLAELRERGRLPIVVGGTGLYFKALLGHLDDIPPVPADIRAKWRSQLNAEGPQRLHLLLFERDAGTAERLRPMDGQRIARALEVLEATGRSLTTWQAGRGDALLDTGRCLKIVIAPERTELRRRIAVRFETMVERGALFEVEAFRARPGAMDGGAARAIGVEELGGVLDDRLDMGSAAALAITRSRQYAKRQDTWFRRQLGEGWIRISTGDRAAWDEFEPTLEILR